MAFFKTSREKYLKGYQKGYQKGVDNTTREKDLQIKILKRNLQSLLETKTKEIARRDSKLLEIEKQMEKFYELFSYAKFMTMNIEDKESIKYRRVTEQYTEVMGFAGKFKLLCINFEKHIPKVQKKIVQYKIENIVE